MSGGYANPVPPAGTTPNPNSASGFGLPGVTPTSGATPTSVGSTDPLQNPALYGLTFDIANTPVTPLDLSGGGGVGDLPLPVQQTTIGEALRTLNTLSRTDLIFLQTELWNAGFFADAAGNPLKIPPVFGELNEDTIVAYKNLLIRSARTPGATAQQVLQSNLDLQVGNQQRTGPAQVPIIGHGYHTTVDLTSAADVNLSTDREAEALVGRLATTAEKSADLTTINQAQLAQGLTKYNATNQMYQDYFQERINARDQQNAAAGIAATSGAAIVNPGGLQSFLAAIREHESGGNYTAKNPNSTASGAYQFLDSTWASEAKAAGYAQYANGRAADAPSQIQDAVAAYMAQNAFNGPAGGNWLKVADIWFLGHVASPSELNVAPPGNGGLTPAHYEQSIQILMQGASSAAPTGTAAAGVAGQSSTAGYVNPFSTGNWGLARTDQGVDYIPKTDSPVVAIGNGVVVNSSMQSGWPGGAIIAYRLSDGPAAGQVVYVAEHLSGLLPTGTQITAGQQIATAHPGYPFIETGWANQAGTNAADMYNGRPDGTSTEGGKSFARFLRSLGAQTSQDPGAGSMFLPGVTGGASPGVQNAPSVTDAQGNTFIPGSLAVTTNAPDATALAYQQFTQGPNRLEYGAHTASGVYGTMLNIIKSGGQTAPTAGTGGV